MDTKWRRLHTQQKGHAHSCIPVSDWILKLPCVDVRFTDWQMCLPVLIMNDDSCTVYATDLNDIYQLTQTLPTYTYSRYMFISFGKLIILLFCAYFTHQKTRPYRAAVCPVRERDLRALYPSACFGAREQQQSENTARNE